MTELNELSMISKYAGERFDLVQAGGGNSSVKISETEMYIKASGFHLSEVTPKAGYAHVRHRDLIKTIQNTDWSIIANKREREGLAADQLKKSTVEGSARPSIETSLHASLRKYTLHTHPLAVNYIVTQASWREILIKLFPKAILVEYQTPGIELCLSLLNQLGEKPERKYLVFLQNHGLIVSSDDVDDITKITDETISKIENYFGISSSYSDVNAVSRMINEEAVEKGLVAYCSHDKNIKQALANDASLIKVPAFYPDYLVYCGYEGVTIKNLNDKSTIKAYIDQYNDHPKVVLFNENIFLIAASIKKARDAEEVLKFHLKVLDSTKEVQSLSSDELKYLGNWEAEKFRQNI